MRWQSARRGASHTSLIGAEMRPTMDAKYFREKAALCLRLADGLSLNNPGRFQLMDLADDFKDRAKELETQVAQQRQRSDLHEVE